jgi:hypothetical protein
VGLSNKVFTKLQALAKKGHFVTHDDAVPPPAKTASTPSNKSKKQGAPAQPLPDLEPLEVPKMTTPPHASPQLAVSPVPDGSVAGSMDSSAFSGSIAEDGTRKKRSKRTGKQTVAGKVAASQETPPPPAVEPPPVQKSCVHYDWKSVVDAVPER